MGWWEDGWDGEGGSNTRHPLEKGCGIILTWCLQEAWVPHSLWVNNFKPQRVAEWVCCCVQHFGWVCAGFICVLQYILLGFLWVPQFLQWVPVGLFWVPRLCVAICNGFLLGSCWVPVFLQQISMGSSWVPVGFRGLVSLSAVGSSWVPAGFRGSVSLIAVGSSWVPAGFRGFVSRPFTHVAWIFVALLLDTLHPRYLERASELTRVSVDFRGFPWISMGYAQKTK